MKKIQTDILVIGSGVAGLSYALKVAEMLPNKKLLLVTKDEAEESNTRYAQGGIAAVLNLLDDSYEQHINDTLIAGDGICNPEVVSMVVHEGPARIKELMALGAAFDHQSNGEPALGREGGHSVNRIMHSKDQTGFEIQKTLMQAVKARPNLEIRMHHFAVDLLLDINGKCRGAKVLDANWRKILVSAQLTVLATGGAGQVYSMTTNPKVATGDGVAMAIRAGAVLENMAFIQFHPTAMYEPMANPCFLISEAVRGFGAEVRNSAGEKFMEKYDKRGSLATRDVVSRAMFTEMKLENANHLFLDLRHLDLDQFALQFPTIFQKCVSIGLRLKKDMIPIAPAAHYLCGGVKTDDNAQTSIPNLLCLGEAACTGLHGANRLASNSLLEAIVFAHRAANLTIAKFDLNVDYAPVFDVDVRASHDNNLKDDHNAVLTIAHLKKLMTESVGIIRSHSELSNALIQIENWQNQHKSMQSPDDLNLRNLLAVGKAIVQDSLNRNENRGGLWFSEINELHT